MPKAGYEVLGHPDIAKIAEKVFPFLSFYLSKNNSFFFNFSYISYNRYIYIFFKKGILVCAKVQMPKFSMFRSININSGIREKQN